MFEKRKSLQELIDEYSRQLMEMGGGYKKNKETETQEIKKETSSPEEAPILTDAPVLEEMLIPEEFGLTDITDEEVSEESYNIIIDPQEDFLKTIPELFLDQPIPDFEFEIDPVSENNMSGGQLKVFVGDKYGRAIAAARVQICLDTEGEQYQTAVEFTAHDGMTRLFDLPGELLAGNIGDNSRYEVFCVADGFHPVRVPVEIIPGQEFEKTVLMRNLT